MYTSSSYGALLNGGRVSNDKVDICTHRRRMVRC